MTLVVGQPAPDFTLPVAGGDTVTLSALRGQPVVIYFYPRDNTPGCTQEACDFRDRFPDFTAARAAIIGISKDSIASHDKFKAKYDLPFVLASDADAAVCQAYGAWGEKTFCGKTSIGLIRSTALVDAVGVVRMIWRGVKVKEHAAKVLEAVKALS